MLVDETGDPIAVGKGMALANALDLTLGCALLLAYCMYLHCMLTPAIGRQKRRRAAYEETAKAEQGRNPRLSFFRQLATRPQHATANIDSFKSLHAEPTRRRSMRALFRRRAKSAAEVPTDQPGMVKV